MRKIIIAAIAGALVFTAGCGGGQPQTIIEEDEFTKYLKTLQQLQDIERGDGILSLIEASVPVLGMSEEVLEKSDSFDYMENVKEYRMNITLFGITGFLDIGVQSGEISVINYLMSEHASEYDQGEVKLLENVVASFGEPAAVNSFGEPEDSLESIKAEFAAEDEYADIKFDVTWENINGTDHSFRFEKEFAMFMNKNLSRYIFS